MENNFLTGQIITYMGNKRKLLPVIEDSVENIRKKLNKDKLTIGDGFSGSGVVSRLLKRKANKLFTNDLAGYSHTLNQCYLSNPNTSTINKLRTYVDNANKIANNNTKNDEEWFSKHWAPNNQKITKEDRVYFSHENGKRIDNIRNYIETIPKKYRPYLLGPLLVESSIHNNTNGQFSAFYKDAEGVGMYGGKKEIDLKRITSPITLSYPIFDVNECQVFPTQKDANEWATSFKDGEPLDIVYYDPPYNKHPYNIYYFLLDIINDWDKTIEIPDTNRGQPLNWKTSDYNSTKKAKKAMKNLIENTNAKYVILSYNDGGIIPIKELDELLQETGKNMEKIPINHKTYNRLKGISNYKREKEYKPVKEYLYIIQLL